MAGAGTSSFVEVDGRRVRITNPDKVLYPEAGTTKAEVIAYYRHVAHWMLPLVEGRPATRKRWPDGVGTSLLPTTPFFQKGLDTATAPSWVVSGVLEHSDGPKAYPLVNDAATLVWLAQLASLEVHVPQWRFAADGTPRNPDRLVLDLDPGPGVTLGDCVELAHLIREVLEGAGLGCIPVTSGSKGIHIYAGLDGSLTSSEASELAHQLARSLEAMRPDLVVSDMKKSLREGRILLDWSQNNSSKTTIAPYSLRGRPHPSVAAPRTWEELTEDVRQLEFTEVLQLLQERGDPLGGLLGADRLSTYRSMREASSTPEPVPSNRPAASTGTTFVIQEHHARRLHHDFRLEHDGVLVSWALPKGPPADPHRNHLAVQTEDHPLEYASFEGRIPQGQYGAGEVKIWDFGTFELHKWRDGKEVIATLHGQPDGGLGGVPRKFALIATPLGGDTKNWLIHLMDTQPVTSEAPAAPGTVVQPMMATPARQWESTAGDWHYEVKWDGYRAIARIRGGVLQLTSRNGHDLGEQFPELRDVVESVDGHDAVLDGEVVVLDAGGVSRFELLQNHAHGGQAQYMVFDLLELDGVCLMERPWRERRELLEKLVFQEQGHVRVPPTLGTDRDAAISRSKELGLEGVVAKHAGSRYEPGRRSASWVKFKNVRTQEAVVVGWSPGNNARSRTLGSVLLAVHEAGRLRYVGKAGSGFTDASLVQARKVLEDIEAVTRPVDDVPEADARGVRWVEPLLVCEVTFTEWTASGRLRHPVWRGWRPDKMAEDVVVEP